MPTFSSSPLVAKRQIRHITPHLAPKEDVEEAADSDENPGQQENGPGQKARRAQSWSSPEVVVPNALGRLLHHHQSTPQFRQPGEAPKEEIEEGPLDNEATVAGPPAAIFAAALQHENRGWSDQNDLASSPIRKRRRFESAAEPNIYPPAIILSPSPSPSLPIPDPFTQDLSDDDLHTPPPSLHLTTTAHPHFLTAANHGNASPLTSISSFPKFILPSPSSPPLPVTGLPQFSPQRRNQKLVPGGLATALRDLVVQTSLRQQQSRTRQRARSGNVARQGARGTAERGTSWDFLIPVIEVTRTADIGTGIALVREKAANDGEGERGTKGWLLIGTGLAGNDNLNQTDVPLQEASLIGMRLPVWNIEALGENWWVGVEWGVIS